MQGNRQAYYLDMNYDRIGDFIDKVSKLSMKDLIGCGSLYNDSSVLLPQRQLYHLDVGVLCELMPQICTEPLAALLGIMQLRKTYVF